MSSMNTTGNRIVNLQQYWDLTFADLSQPIAKSQDRSGCLSQTRQHLMATIFILGT